MVYGITDCPACLKVQAHLMENDLQYVFIQMDFSKSYRDSIKEEFSWKTFPIIIKVDAAAEELIGGYDELCLNIKKKTF
jgi:glutaredoxin